MKFNMVFNRYIQMAQKSGFDPEIFSLAEKTNQDWWNNRGDMFLKDVRK